MGKWYNKKFKLNEFDWNKTQEKNYISRGNVKWQEWIARFKKIGITKNPGVILDSTDAFFYDNFIGNKDKHYNCSLQDISTIPVATHNRQVDSDNSILIPLRWPTLNDIADDFKKNPDLYNFSEKKNEVVWRGKLTGQDKTGIRAPFCFNIEKSINEYHRFAVVKMWYAKHNIKFVDDYMVVKEHANRDKFDQMLNVPLVQQNLLYLDGIMYFHNVGMVGSYMRFKKEMCQYKYILNLDGNDSSSAITWILKSNSLMIGPVPKWHIIVNFQLKPWVHYVPLKDDTSDLEEKLEWCNSNQEECERIVKNASEYISQFNEQTEQKIEKRIFEKLYENAEK
jgi:hypothetical protein